MPNEPIEDSQQSVINLNNTQTNKESLPITAKKSTKIGRNDKVIIQKNEAKKTLKWKQAELLIANDGWTFVTTC